jgi:hypothetical protein
MKKISILFSTLLLAVGAFAQSKSAINSNQESAKTPASAQEIRLSEMNGSENLSMPKAQRGAEFFCEDFSNGLDGNNPFGAWTAEDSGGNTIWMMATANSPAGEYSSNLNAMASPTAANGWVIFDCDFFNTPSSPGPYESVTGFLTAPEMNMTGMSSVIVEFYQYFRYCCAGASPMFLEVSVNGGDDWLAFPSIGDFVASANSLSENPFFTKVDISCVAANEPSVLIRWAYNTAGGNYSHYFWGLDDICVYENTAVNDLEITQVTNGDIFNIWEYRVTPMEQAISSADGGMVAGVIFRNNGTADQSNVEITVEILDDADNVLTTIVTDPFDMPAFANTPECPSMMLDTLFLQTGWEPTGMGTYFVRATISSDIADETVENDMKIRQIEYTSDEYGHDGPMDFDLEIGALENQDNPNLFNRTGYGNFYTCPNEGSIAYGITSVFGESSDGGTEFTAGLAEVIEFLDDNAFVTGGEFVFDEEWISGDPYYLPFEDEYDLANDQVYFAAVFTNEETTSGNLTVLANSLTDNDNSTAVINLNADEEPTWFTRQDWTPAIRLILSNRVGVNEIDPSTGLVAFQVNPNPASEVANLNFDLNANTVVAYEVRDMSGKLVAFKNLGRFNEGNNNVQINVSNYAAGNYNVSLVIGGQHFVTRQMSVIK